MILSAEYDERAVMQCLMKITDEARKGRKHHLLHTTIQDVLATTYTRLVGYYMDNRVAK